MKDDYLSVPSNQFSCQRFPHCYLFLCLGLATGNLPADLLFVCQAILVGLFVCLWFRVLPLLIL